MLREFIDFVDASFPSIPYAEKEEAKRAIEQFKKTGHVVNYLSSKVLPDLSQGDVLSDVPFVFFDSEGCLHKYRSKAMIVNNSCHIENNSYLTLVPLIDICAFDDKKDYKAAIVNNTIYEILYLPDQKLCDCFVDLSRPTTYDSDLLKGQIAKGRIKRVASLSQIGYYFFLVKLSIYLTRREDPKTQSDR